METKPSLWEKNSETFKPLRLPKCPPNSISQQELQINNDLINGHRELPHISNNSKGNNITKDIIANSTLKVDAPEFYPSNHIFDNHLEAHVRVKNSETLCERNEDSSDIIRLKQIISTLTKDPGQFDNLLDLFMETLQPYLEDIIALSIIAQLLVEQAISNSNFRYTGARLCWYVEQNCPEFRAELHLRCKKQLEENTNKQNVLLFIAELYTQLPHLTVYGALLIDCYKQLLSKGGSDNIKCICQALKLTGYSLEHSNKTELDEVFKQLELSKPSVNGSVKNLINSVINLRSSNWGYSHETSNEINHVADTYYFGELENTTFFRTDGDTFTNEEREFLSAHLDSNLEYFSDNSDPDDLCDPEPEMDEEIQAAFKEFVQLSKH